MPMTGTDVYTYWRSCTSGAPDAALKVPTETNPDEAPQPGLYKTRKFKGGPLVPARIFLTDQEGTVVSKWAEGLIVHIDVDGTPINNVSTYTGHIFFKPVTKQDWEHYKAQKCWPGEIAVDATGGDNSKNMTLPDQIDALIAEAGEWLASIGGKAKTREQANEATNWKGKIAKVGNEADAEREKEKKPHWDAAKAVDAKWFPHVHKAEDAAKTIGALADAWATAERKRLQDEAAEAHRKEQEAHRAKMEEHRKAQEEAAAKAAVERARIEEERLAAAESAVAAGANPELLADVLESLPTAADIIEEVVAPPPPPPPPPAPVKIEPLGGQFTRRSSAKAKMVYTVVDYDKAYAVVKDNAKVREAIAKAAADLCKTMGKAIDGCHGEEAVKVS